MPGRHRGPCERDGRVYQSRKNDRGIDGCPVACAKKILEHAGFKADEYVQVTEMGIEKNHGFDYPQSELNKVVNHLKDRISQRRIA